MNSQKIPIVLNCIAALVGAFGQYFYKKGGEELAKGGSPVNPSVIIGIVLFCAVMALFVASYRLGGRISVVYPFYATTFVWGTILGVLLQKEPWHQAYLVGLALVLTGTAIIAWAGGQAA